MRTLIIILAGIVLYIIGFLVSKYLAGSGTASHNIVTIIFIMAWFIISAVNMWLGITWAGYTFMEELPIFLLIFLVPSVLALFIQWKFL